MEKIFLTELDSQLVCKIEIFSLQRSPETCCTIFFFYHHFVDFGTLRISRVQNLGVQSSMK